MSMQNTTFWHKVGEMGVGEMGVGKTGVLTFLAVLSTILYRMY